MNRKGKTMIHLAVTAVLLFLLLNYSHLFFTQEAVFKAYEKDRHYGPSEKILEKGSLQDGSGYIIGIYGGTPSVVEMKKKAGIFWTYESVYLDYEPVTKPVEIRALTLCRHILTWITDPEIVKVTYGIEMNNNNGDAGTVEDTVDVGAEGYVLTDYSHLFERCDIADYFVGYVYGYNAEGEEIYRMENRAKPLKPTKTGPLEWDTSLK